MNEIPLGHRLRADLNAAQRKLEDAQQLCNALALAAQLADEVDRLSSELADATSGDAPES